MEMRDVMEVTDHMMAYLIGAEEELSIVTHVDGEEQDFFNEQDRIHMADVKDLFLGGLKVRTICLILAALLILVLAVRKADLKRFLPGCYFRALGFSWRQRRFLPPRLPLILPDVSLFSMRFFLPMTYGSLIQPQII